MYLANTTKQHIRLNLRVPETTRIGVVEIDSGHQVVIGGDWSAAQTDAVVKYLERFGALPDSAVNRRLVGYSGLLYGMVKPVEEDHIQVAHEAVVTAQVDRAAGEFTRTALGVDAGLRDKRTKRRRAVRTQLSAKEILPRGTRPTGHEVDVSVTVDPQGRDDPQVTQ